MNTAFFVPSRDFLFTPCRPSKIKWRVHGAKVEGEKYSLVCISPLPCSRGVSGRKEDLARAHNLKSRLATRNKNAIVEEVPLVAAEIFQLFAIQHRRRLRMYRGVMIPGALRRKTSRINKFFWYQRQLLEEHSMLF